MTEKTYLTNLGTIHYWVNEFEADRKTLVFLPGLTATHELFDKQIEYFEADYNCFVWDAPAHGESYPYDYNFKLEDKAKWLHEIFEIEGIKKPVVVGQSMGGYVAQMFMEIYPGELGGFVSIDSCSLKRKYVTAFDIWALKRVEPIYRMYPWNSLKKTGSNGCAETEYGRALMRMMMEKFDGNQEWYSKLSGHGFYMLAEALESSREFKIDCPAILICGTKDKAGSAKRYNKKWTKGENLPMYWIEGAGHNSNTDEPEKVNALIEDLVKK